MFYKKTRKRKNTDTHTCHVPFDCMFEDLCQFRHFLSPKRYFQSLLFHLFFILLVYSFFEMFFKVFFFFFAQSRVMAKTFYKTASLSFMTHDGNCCERISCQLGHSQVVKSTFCLRFSIFLLCKQLLLNLFRSFHLL